MAKPSGRRTSQFSLPQGQPQPQIPSLENNFTGGLKTEYTGLNFPENACTVTNNVTFTRTGNIERRNGFDLEANYTSRATTVANNSLSSFLWENAGGDGETQILVEQVGETLNFYLSTNATTSKPLSTTWFSAIGLATFIAQGGSFTSSLECQYTSGNGYLFVFHPDLDPFYCTYSAGVVTASPITLQQRDFAGIPESIADTFRGVAATESTEHVYNLQNQGWTNAGGFNAISNTVNNSQTGIKTFTVQSGLTVSLGSQLAITANFTFPGFTSVILSGNAISYSGTTLVVDVVSSSNAQNYNFNYWTFGTINQSNMLTWIGATGAYPSNSDVWWQFKNSSGVFDPATTIGNVTLSSPAPKGSYILNVFNQDRGNVSGIAAGLLTVINTTVRPRTGAWFAGRVWYAGVDASFAISGDAPFTTWTENIYFSQVVDGVNKFGRCYQVNDPTSEDLFDLLPTDGGVITIQGSGAIYKLFPVLNGVLVFAANGIWFITGSQGIGFSATDFTVSKLSGEHSISGTSFVSVLGYPMFWNNDGIYAVMPGQSLTSGQKSLEVKNLTLTTIKQFYQAIPISSKKNARGAYNHLTGVIQWLYKSTEATSTTDAYSFDSILNFLTYTEAFYTWTLPNLGTSNTPYLHTIIYIEGPGGLNVPLPTFKYSTSYYDSSGSAYITFSEERDSINWVDFISSVPPGISYTSTFVTGYKLKGQGQRKFQPQYIYMYSELPAYAFKIQGVWGYAATLASNQFSTEQVITVNKPTSFNKDIRRVRIRGNGYVLQYKIDSVAGKPFNFAGWSVLDVIGIS
jgi:hypothetical protein